METVTISLEKYNEMRDEIARLKKENEQKFIYKKEVPFSVFVISVIAAFCIYISFFHSTLF